MLRTTTYLPSEPLKPYVMFYTHKLLSTAPAHIASYKDHFLEFYLQGRYTVCAIKSGERFKTYDGIYMGMQTQRNYEIIVDGAYSMFFVKFKPTAYYRMFGKPMNEFADQATALDSLPGANWFELHERLSSTNDPQMMVHLVEGALLKIIAKNNPVTGPFEAMVDRIYACNGDVNLNWLANQCNISNRQLERKFKALIGVSPKQFINKIKFHYTLQLKFASPSTNWTELSYDAGYFDQAHMVRSIKKYSGFSPSGFIKLIPELSIN
jgi:AraC-like DNA-binding protein